MHGKNDTEPVECGHCGNFGSMLVLFEHNGIQTIELDEPGLFSVVSLSSDRGFIYRLLKCAVCEGILLDRVFYTDQSPDYQETLHPQPLQVPDWLPDRISREYGLAIKERLRNPNGYAALLGRVLEAVCDDKNVQDFKLKTRLEQLVTKEQMQAIQGGVTGLRNVGSHADAGVLTSADVWLLEALTRYVLDHLYLAPKLNADALKIEKERRAENQESSSKR